MYLFSFCLGSKDVSFFICNVFNGLMSIYLSKDVSVGDVFFVIGLLGSFYLCVVECLVFMLVGGIGFVFIFFMFVLFV